jgi:hypothetical protein
MKRPSPEASAGSWAAYVPSPEVPWTLKRVVHLHRRAGFAATWDELQRDLKEGPEPSIARLLSGTARLQGVPSNFEEVSATLSADPRFFGGARFGARWIYRMYRGPDPLGERVALMWHNHFATSMQKVHDATLMLRQNEIFRRLGRAPFGALLNAVVRDPAMLTWLDASTNRKGHPNENLGRELMELFTLGVGHYSETDVKEAARALTGWTIRDHAFYADPKEHDDGSKTLFGRAGNFTADDLIGMLLGNPATADRLAWRLSQQFLGEGTVDRATLGALAAGLRDHQLDIGWAVATILRSRAFFADENLGRRVVGPVELVVSLPRALGLFDPSPSTLLLADWAGRLGQELFHPPNVGGWPEGRAWVTHQGMIGRANFAASLVGGRLFRDPRPFDPLAFAERHGRGSRPGDLLDFYSELFLGRTAEGPWRSRVEAASADRSLAEVDRARRSLALLLASPEAQVC